MKHKLLVKELEKNGYEIKRHKWHSKLYFVENFERTLTWHVENGIAECLNAHCRNNMNEYYQNHLLGYFCKTIEEAIFSLENKAA